jgi:hypothetical protein
VEVGLGRGDSSRALEVRLGVRNLPLTSFLEADVHVAARDFRTTASIRPPSGGGETPHPTRFAGHFLPRGEKGRSVGLP